MLLPVIFSGAAATAGRTGRCHNAHPAVETAPFMACIARASRGSTCNYRLQQCRARSPCSNICPALPRQRSGLPDSGHSTLDARSLVFPGNIVEETIVCSVHQYAKEPFKISASDKGTVSHHVGEAIVVPVCPPRTSPEHAAMLAVPAEGWRRTCRVAPASFALLLYRLAPFNISESRVRDPG